MLAVSFSSLISWPAFLYLYLHHLSYFVSSEESKTKQKIPRDSLSFVHHGITEKLFLKKQIKKFKGLLIFPQSENTDLK